MNHMVARVYRVIKVGLGYNVGVTIPLDLINQLAAIEEVAWLHIQEVLTKFPVCSYMQVHQDFHSFVSGRHTD